MLFVLAIIVWCLFNPYVQGYKHKLIVVVVLSEFKQTRCVVFCCLSTSFRTGTLTHEHLCSHLRTILCTIELHNLSSVYTPHIIMVLFWFLCCTAVLICYVSWSLWCWFGLCVQSYKHNLQLVLDQTRSYSLNTPHRNCYSFLQTLVNLQPAFPRENQITTFCILSTKQRTSSRQ